MYNSQCVCTVEDICELSVDSKKRKYYVMHMVYEVNTIIKIPVDSQNVLMRRLISQEAAHDLIGRLSSVKPFWFDDKNVRAQEFKKALKSGDCDEWAKLVKTLFSKKIEQGEKGKKLSAADETVLKTAEILLQSELATTLGMPVDEIADTISKELAS